MEIEVGEYVRTISGNIDKVDALYGMIENTIHLENHKWQSIKNIVKHSKDIIDLIQEDDLIEIEYEISDKTIQNEVVQVIRNFQGILYVNTYVGKFSIQDLEHYNRKILSISTKEQIKQIEYRIKE